jgi:hypothetical protein
MKNFQGFGAFIRFSRPHNSKPERNKPDRPAPDVQSALPDALHHELQKLSFDDRFFDIGYHAALKVGCEMLFEVPAILIEPKGDRCAAIQCRQKGGDELFFLVFEAARGTISIINENEVSQTVLDFTRSYAGVLGMIANDRKVVKPLIH